MAWRILPLFFLMLCAGCNKKTTSKVTITHTSSSDAVDDYPQTMPENTPIKKLDTARDVDYMTDRAKDMILELNLIRYNPPAYVPVVEAYLEHLKEQKQYYDASGKSFVNEQLKTGKELIKVLKKTPPLHILKPHEGVFQAAKEHGEWLKKKNTTGHKGKNNSWPWDRIIKAAPDMEDGNENLVGGPSSIREPIMLLLIDSGIDGRGHRENILNPDWEYVGCYEVGTIKIFPHYWVHEFAKPK